MVWLIAKSLTIFCSQLSSAKEDVTQTSMISCMSQLRVTLKDAYFQKGDFLKSYWAKWPRKQVAFFHGRTVKGAESKIFTCKPRSIFESFRLTRLRPCPHVSVFIWKRNFFFTDTTFVHTYRWKRNFSKTLSKVERFENAVFACTCGQTKTELFENVEDTLSVPIHSAQY